MDPAQRVVRGPSGRHRPVVANAPGLLVIGTGSLSESVCAALAEAATGPMQVVVLGRRQAAARQVCYLAGAVAAARRTPVEFRPVSASDGSLPEVLPGLLRESVPDGVFLCASRQSPWERSHRPSGWTDLLQETGFGLTLPLHSELAGSVGQSVAATPHAPWFVNACFPDAVNPVLVGTGTPVLCGIGNVAILAASLTAALGLADERPLRMLAHHAHLQAPPTPADEALAWVDGAPVADVGLLAAPQRQVERQSLNRVTGLVAARLLDVLLQRSSLDTHAPAPAGLPGGYPVTVSDGGVTLRLPAGTSVGDAVDFNQRAARRDGVVVDGTEIRFSATTCQALAGHLPDWPEVMDAAEVGTWGERLLSLRDRLRLVPDRTSGQRDLSGRSPVPTPD